MSSNAPSTTTATPSLLRTTAYALPFVLAHLAVLGAIWSGVTATSLVVCVVLFAVRMFGVSAGYHRYFAHRTYEMGRVGQFLMAVLAQTSSQKGVLWWAAHHRNHHRYSDQPEDVHSPVQKGFWYAHVGWIFDPRNGPTRSTKVRDLSRFPELRWLDRYYYVPPVALGVLVFLLFGWPGLFIGFFLSTVLLWHATFTINSLAHVFGRRRYDTPDDSRNSLLLALLTGGEGWHNNHHYHMFSVRQGFRWWQIDINYYVLRGLRAVRLIGPLREPPPELLRGEEAPPRRSASRRRVDPVAPETGEDAFGTDEDASGTDEQASSHDRSAA